VLPKKIRIDRSPSQRCSFEGTRARLASEIARFSSPKQFKFGRIPSTVTAESAKAANTVGRSSKEDEGIEKHTHEDGINRLIVSEVLAVQSEVILDARNDD
jgi:hypothetical protein